MLELKESNIFYKPYHRIRRFFKPHMYWTQEDFDKAKEQAARFKFFFSQDPESVAGRTGVIKLENPVDRIEPSYKLNSELRSFSIHKHEDSCVNVYSRCIGTQSVGADFMLSFGATIDVLKNNQTVSIDTSKVVDVFLSKDQLHNLYKSIKNALEYEKELSEKAESIS